METLRSLPVVASLVLGAASCALATAGLPAESGSTEASGGSDTTSSGTSAQGGGGAAASTTTTATTSTATTSTTSTATASTSTGAGGACAGACEAIPKGWALVRAKAIGASDPLDACPSGAPSRWYTGPADHADCSQCMCSSGACGAPKLQCSYDKDDCSSDSYHYTAVSTDTCVNMTNLPYGANTTGSCKLLGNSNVDKMCAPTGGSQVQNPKWAGAQRTCALTDAGGCMGGQLCVPAQPQSGESICVMKMGGDPCPAGYPNAIQVFADGDDMRSCDSCSCSTMCSGGSYVVHDFDSCQDAGNMAYTIDASSGCVATPGIFDASSGSITPIFPKAMDACTGGDGHGKVSGNGAQKICCK